MSLYPSILAGQKITASLLQSMLPQTVFKAANTDRASVTTFADDPELTLQLLASAVYQVEMRIYFATTTGTGAPLFKTAWTVPSGATGNRSATGPGSTAADPGADNIVMHSGVHAFGTSVTYGGRASAVNQCVAIETGTVITTSAGTLALQWAQATSSATAVRVASGSVITVRRLA